MTTTLESSARPRALQRAAARRGLLFLTVTGLAWGTTGAVSDLVYRSSDMGPIALSFWRHLGGMALLLVAIAFLRSRRRRPAAAAKGGLPRVVVLGCIGVAMAVFQTAYFAAVESTGVAVATIVTLGSGPILTAIGGRIFLGERVGLGGAGAIAGALVGLTVLVVGNGAGVASPAGVALSVLSASGYAVFTLLGRHAGGAGEDPFTLTVWAFGIGAAVLVVPAAFEGLIPPTDQLAHVALLIGYLAVFTTALAYPFYFAGTARVRATTAAVMMLLEPATAAVLAVSLLGEPLTVATAAGALVMLASIACLAAAESRA
ncbi:DMT family transporter [Glycomyces buryatensis]|uniref:EamA/RhaT family transporter n=1 Tax=Glycomyces buryatensis TaxID=2570927 RepID=A0A4V4HSU8_9ACTN|nr:EamA family transporter [Glycomyces buryatensis]THV43056.1 EamA/RhaT family transporter [Glycomyces buryatensis]